MKTIIACLFLLAPLAAQAQLLKCIGPGGKVEYASQCPPGSREIQTGIRNQPGKIQSPPPAAAGQKSLAEREADFRKRRQDAAEEEKKAQQKAAQSAEQKEACERAQLYVRSIQSGQRIAQLDPKTGERVFLSDADRPAELARAQRVADSNCK